jgi:organic radical activating enzyme
MSNDLIRWRDRHLNKISCSFCAAKWYNACLHLGQGLTNSCHLPLPHPIDLKEILKNPAALHNTNHKKQMRKMMLSGIKPAECSYCWKIEDMGIESVSDRIFKSQAYSAEDIAAIKDIPWDADILLKTVEVSFDRTCNFACSYCNAGYSTTWEKELKQNGAYQNFKTANAGFYSSDGSWADVYGKNSDDNPYVQAFLEWWPELSKSLQEIRITGGEPSQSHNFWKFVEMLKQYPSKTMNFAVNSNLGLNPETLDKMINITKEIPLKSFTLYTSCESYGKHAEYIRDGLDYKLWRNNLVKIIEQSKFNSVIIMMTINSLCLFSITEFMDDMISLKNKYGYNKPIIDLNILRWPSFMSPLMLPDDIKETLCNKLENWLKSNKHRGNLIINEISQIERLIDYIKVVNRGHNNTETDKEIHYHDFKSFYTQYDIRRNKNFVSTFPELKEWYENIELSKNYPIKPLSKGRPPGFEIGEYISDKGNYNIQIEEPKPVKKKLI